MTADGHNTWMSTEPVDRVPRWLARTHLAALLLAGAAWIGAVVALALAVTR